MISTCCQSVSSISLTSLRMTESDPTDSETFLVHVWTDSVTPDGFGDYLRWNIENLKTGEHHAGGPACQLGVQCPVRVARSDSGQQPGQPGTVPDALAKWIQLLPNCERQENQVVHACRRVERSGAQVSIADSAGAVLAASGARMIGLGIGGIGRAAPCSDLLPLFMGAACAAPEGCADSGGAG